jgi:hypothetical protein
MTSLLIAATPLSKHVNGIYVSNIHLFPEKFKPDILDMEEYPA